MKAVLDTNIIVSAIMSRFGAPKRIMDAWRIGQFELITSADLLAEARRVLGRADMRRRGSFDTATADEVLALLEQHASTAQITRRIHAVTRDPDDDRVLEAAVAGEAGVIVSGDTHLLELGEFEGIRIMTPSQFVAVLDDVAG